MRLLSLLTLLVLPLLLSACAQPNAPKLCAMTTAKELGVYRVEAHAYGPSCDKAVSSLTVRDGSGKPVWVYAGLPVQLSYDMDPVKGPTREQLKTFLDTWLDTAKLETTAALPVWAAGAKGPGAEDEPGVGGTAYDRESYEAIRGQKAPQICYATGVESFECIWITPEGAATVILAGGL
jgi:hypothetical protein